jgi:beta-N-acetylhexosaminidase
MSDPEAGLATDAGRLVMVGFRGTTPEEVGPLAGQLRRGEVGGVVLFDVDRGPGDAPGAASDPAGPQLTGRTRNVVSAEQVRELVAGLRRLAAAGGNDHLLVAADQEGGRVARFGERHGFPPTLPARELGRSGDPERTRAQAAEMAGTLAALGVDLNLAPVVDLDLAPEGPAIGALGRSFSPDAQEVIRHARAFVEAHRARGVATALKHFPGHGSAAADSHVAMADVTATWSPAELEPYRALIAEGLADVVMTAHVLHRALDPEWPATLSPAVVTGLLRGELDFRGVVMTDDLQMGAIAGGHRPATVIRRALVAGADILLFANNSPGVYEYDAAPLAVETILRLVERGDVPAGRVAEAAARVRRLATRGPAPDDALI